MIQTLRAWYDRHFSDPQAIILLLTLAAVFATIVIAGGTLAPVLASMVIAYLLEGMVRRLEKWGVARLIAVIGVFLLFLLFVVLVIFLLLPQLYNQTRELVTELPVMIAQAQTALLTLPARYPDLFTEAQINEMVTTLRDDMAAIGKSVLTWSLSSVVGAITVLVYLILVPLLVFFFMKDKQLIIRWLGGYLPSNRGLLNIVWRDVDRQIGNYVRGKFIEILIIWLVCLITFIWFGLNFAMLLAVLVGLSVIIPYIGASVVTIPVAAVAYFQWGLGSDFYWVVAAYLVIQALDGNALVPLLFSEVVDLHPIAIIVAILVFGGLWGFWGVFFAIPLATLVQAVLKAWPDTSVTTAR
ncbi:MAG: AI-2E family transporter [Gammaproteobacteria bacterium]|nr:AI-2E family transporter [Gammaproteobacteria bacterium]